MASIEPTKFTWVHYTDDNGKRKRRKKALPGSSFKVRYRKPDGSEGSKTEPTITAANRWLEANGADIQRSEWVDPKLRRAKFSDWADAYERGLHRHSPSYARRARQIMKNHVRPYWDGWKIAQIDYQDVEDWLTYLHSKGTLGPKSVQMGLTALSGVLKGAIKSKVLKENPAAGHSIKVPKQSGQVLELADLERLVRSVPANYTRWASAVLFLIYTGCRPAEMTGLRFGRLNLLKRTVHICETLTEVGGRLIPGPTKTEQERILPLPPFLADVLAAHLQDRQKRLGRPLQADDYVFTGWAGGGLRTSWFRAAVMVPALRGAGLPTTFRTYDIRHSHASQVIDMGASPLAVKERLGHTDVLTTFRKYGHLFEGVQDKLAQELEFARASAVTVADETATVIDLAGRRAAAPEWRLCDHCGIRRHRAHGRCTTCHNYWKRKGVERPRELDAPADQQASGETG